MYGSADFVNFRKIEANMSDAIFVINAGSSSIKFALFQIADLQLLLRGQIAGIGVAADCEFNIDETRVSSLDRCRETLPGIRDHHQALGLINFTHAGYIKMPGYRFGREVRKNACGVGRFEFGQA